MKTAEISISNADILLSFSLLVRLLLNFRYLFPSDYTYRPVGINRLFVYMENKAYYTGNRRLYGNCIFLIHENKLTDSKFVDYIAKSHTEVMYGTGAFSGYCCRSRSFHFDQSGKS